MQLKMPNVTAPTLKKDYLRFEIWHITVDKNELRKVRILEVLLLKKRQQYLQNQFISILFPWAKSRGYDLTPRWGW